MTMLHRRVTDAEDFPPLEHVRETDTAAAARHVLGMPISALVAIGALLSALFGVWLTHDRAIAATSTQQQQVEQRVRKLEDRDEKRTETDSAVAAALTRIETKLDDVKERVVRVENRQQGGK